MRRFLGLTLGLLTITALMGCTPPPSDLSEADVAAIRAQIDTYVSTALAGDWEAWGTTLAPDFIMMPPSQPILVGRDAAVAMVKAGPTPTTFTVTVDEVAGRGDLAYARGTYDEAGTLADGTPFSDRGKWLQVLRRRTDGTWLYTRLLYHSDVAAPRPPE